MFAKIRWAAVLIMITVGVTFVAPLAQAKGLDNFTITEYDVALQLGKDSDGRSTLKTTETITADFPPNQNKGIVRDFVKTYDGHSVDFSLQSVTDENDTPLEYKWDNDTLQIYREGVYVEGKKTYKITYTQRDVTKFYKDTGNNEFYWDAIGVEWRVPIKQANVSLQLTPDIAAKVRSDLHCYKGSSGRNESCDMPVMTTRDNPITLYRVSASGLKPAEGLTVALGFQPETFVGYEPSMGEKIMQWLMIASGVSNVALGVPLLIAGIVASRRRHVQSQIDRGVKKVLEQPKVVEYTPPKDRSVLESSYVRTSVMGGSDISAQLIDWAVRHYIVIRQTKEKNWIGKAEYSFEVLKPFDDLSQPEQTLARAIFRGMPEVGAKITTKKMTSRRSAITGAFADIGESVIKESGLYEEDKEAKEYFSKLCKRSAVGFFVLLLNVPLLLLAIYSFIFSSSSSQFLSKEGARLKRYLEGLKEYIGVAEQKRLELLQSPDGATKVGAVDVSDKGALIKLYEKVLPYAIMFGQEKEWTKQLGHLYEEAGTSPDWTIGSTAFNAAAFSSMMSSVNSTVSSASSYSSSSGGSSGGGSAGGGGGGGGGGGI